MRYNPNTEQGLNINDIAAQCHQVIDKAPVNAPTWGELQQLNDATMRLGYRSHSRWHNCVQISHGMDVAQAMGNWAEYRRLRAQLITGLW